MPRKISIKTVQVHHQCSCGLNSVYEDTVLVKFKDFGRHCIKRIKDKATSKWFYSMHIKSDLCHCYDDEL
jgi:hypothetical protein